MERDTLLGLSVEIFICGEIDCESDCVIVQTRQEVRKKD